MLHSTYVAATLGLGGLNRAPSDQGIRVLLKMV